MRKLLILPVVLLIIASCNKDSSTATPTIPTIPGTMTVDINGVPDTFNTRATANQGSGIYGNQAYGIQVIGFDDKGGVDSTSMNFYIEGGIPVTVGNYNSYNNGGTSPYRVYLFYNENATGSSYDSDGGIGAPPDTIRIAITSIDSTITPGNI